MDSQARRPYAAPRIVDVGAVEHLTGGHRDPIFDGYSNAKRIGHWGDFWFAYRPQRSLGGAGASALS